MGTRTIGLEETIANHEVGLESLMSDATPTIVKMAELELGSGLIHSAFMRLLDMPLNFPTELYTLLVHEFFHRIMGLVLSLNPSKIMLNPNVGKVAMDLERDAPNMIGVDPSISQQAIVYFHPGTPLQNIAFFSSPYIVETVIGYGLFELGLSIQNLPFGRHAGRVLTGIAACLIASPITYTILSSGPWDQTDMYNLAVNMSTLLHQDPSKITQVDTYIAAAGFTLGMFALYKLPDMLAYANEKIRNRNNAIAS